MMFWILMPCNIITLLLIYFNFSITAKPDKSMVLGVHIPYSELENSEVKKILSSFKQVIKRTFWVAFAVQLSFYFFKDFVSLSTIFCLTFVFGIIGIYGYIFAFYNNKMLDLKKQNNWQSKNGTHIITIDTELSRLKDTFPVSVKWFLPPCIVTAGCIFWVLRFSDKILSENFWLVLVALVILLCGLLQYYFFSKASPVTYCDDSEINLAINKLYHHNWSKFCVVVSYTSLFYLPFIFYPAYQKFYIYYLLAVTLLTSVIIFIYMLYIHRVLKKSRDRLLAIAQSPIEEDDGEYWRYRVWQRESTPFCRKPNLYYNRFKGG